MHFYNSTSVLQRRVVFGLDKPGITDIAVNAAKLCRKLEETVPDTQVLYEYSPESFTQTEIEYAVEICAEVTDVIDPGSDEKLILNLPATVEMYTPNIYGDVIEYFHRNIPNRDKVVLSLHPHNDRGCAVAAAEFGVMAGADRVEGTLFGNGERTGNVDIVTLALNLFSQGVDPELDLSDIDRIRRVAEYCNRLPVHHATPTPATSSTRRSRAATRTPSRRACRPSTTTTTMWEVPYLPIDPKHVGRTYEAVIRVNSQSGKGGVAYIMESEHGLHLPRRLQIEFSKSIQHVTEDTGTEISPVEMWDRFEEIYLTDGRVELRSQEVTTDDDRATITAQISVDGEPTTVHGEGNGPIAAFVDALRRELDIEVDIVDYSEHAASSGSDATAVAYVEVQTPDGEICWGVGRHPSILAASLRAVVSAVNRIAR